VRLRTVGGYAVHITRANTHAHKHKHKYKHRKLSFYPSFYLFHGSRIQITLEERLRLIYDSYWLQPYMHKVGRCTANALGLVRGVSSSNLDLATGYTEVIFDITLMK
jgi:hypothetical protein